MSRFVWNRRALRDFVAAVVLLGAALAAALAGSGAAERGDRVAAVGASLLALVLAAAVALTIVPRLARRVDFRRWLLPVSFGITREGGFYILGIFLLGLAAVNTGNNLLFLILSALLAAIIASGIAARISLRSIAVSLQAPENVFERERVVLSVALRNRKRIFPSFSVVVEDTSPEGPGARPGRSRVAAAARWLVGRPKEPDRFRAAGRVLRRPAYFPVVAAGESRTELVAQTYPRRGRYELGGFEISTRFPFGFFRRGERVRASGQVVVYPAIKEVSSYFHLLPFLPGRLEGMHAGPGESLYAIRKYQEGESARRVDWKASAKIGTLMAREYARDEESKFCLILDTLLDASVAGQPGAADRFERAVSLAASLAAHFADEGAELELLTPDGYVPRGLGKPQLYRILDALATVEPQRVAAAPSSDLTGELSGILDPASLSEVLSDKIFKIIVTSKPRGSFPATIWRSSHIVYFDEL